MIDTTPRTCRGCEAPLERRPGECDYRWQRRVYCSRSCYHASRLGNRRCRHCEAPLTSTGKNPPLFCNMVCLETFNRQQMRKCAVCRCVLRRRLNESDRQWVTRRQCSQRCNSIRRRQLREQATRRYCVPPPPVCKCGHRACSELPVGTRRMLGGVEMEVRAHLNVRGVRVAYVDELYGHTKYAEVAWKRFAAAPLVAT